MSEATTTPGNQGDGDQNDGDQNDGTVKEALKNDWEQTKSDLPGVEGKDLDQDVDDTIKQAAGDEPTDASQN